MSEEIKKEINTNEGKKNEKKIIKKIIKILAIAVIALIIISALPFLYFVGVILYSMFIDVPSKPEAPLKSVSVNKSKTKYVPSFKPLLQTNSIFQLQ